MRVSKRSNNGLPTYQQVTKTEASVGSLDSPNVGGAAANDPTLKQLAQKAMDEHLNQILDVKTSPVKFLEESSGEKKSNGSLGTPLLEMAVASYVKETRKQEFTEADEDGFKMKPFAVSMIS